MQTLKKLLRKSDNPLQQIVKRLAELENLLMTKDKRESWLNLDFVQNNIRNLEWSRGI